MQQTTENTGKRNTGHQAIAEVAGWTNIHQPGFYASRTTGQGYRITPDLLIQGASPSLSVLGAENERFVRLSDDPFVPTSAARLLCADNDISPRF
jgi:hypothetical protein